MTRHDRPSLKPGNFFRTADIIGEGVDPDVYQCNGPDVHVFASTRPVAVCPTCEHDVGIASLSRLKIFNGQSNV